MADQRKQRKNNASKKVLTRKVALFGFRGVGKSTVARELAAIWNTEFFSLDKEIEKTEHKRISEIVESEGWDAFRDKEWANFSEFASRDGAFILDTGGGIVESAPSASLQEKIDVFKKHFFCIYLYADDNKLLARLEAAHKNQSRPDLPGGKEGLRDTLKRRKPLYQRAAHAVVDVTDCNAREAAQRVQQMAGNNVMGDKHD